MSDREHHRKQWFVNLNMRRQRSSISVHFTSIYSSIVL